ncbi:MAG: fimbrial protein FimV [Methylobacter sp.]|nr:MAG: fimbrial protein FimV [Methylobacter sp.]
MVTIVKKSSVRNLTKTLAVVSLLASTSGYTLGIGEIKLHSALNQNLDAEISLTLSGESLSDIKVNLAAPEKFDEAGVPWTYFLSKIKFETITHSNGAAIIKLTSREALKEPFLDFLLEVSWPKGNLYREFTVLVDPPSVYNQATIPVSTSAESYVQPPIATSQRQLHANGGLSSNGEYGPTLENDTLWSVAERVREQGDVSVEQMMIALYEANPHAFYKENVYALMAGKTLKIPERAAILKLSRNQALAAFNQHKKAWKKSSAPAHAEGAKEKPVPSKAEVSADNQLTLAAPSEATVEGRAVVAPVGEQVSAEKKAPVTSEVVKDKAAPNVAEGTEGAEEGAGGVASADGVAQDKVAELEKQLAMMQELIALKDQQLAVLQKQPQANAAVAQQQAVPEAVVAAKPADKAMPAPPKTAVQPVKPVQPVASPKPESSLLDSYYLGVGGVGAAVLALLGWLWWRKRKVDEETNTESMFASSIVIKTPEVDESLSVPVVEDAAVHDVGTVGESSFLSEFTPSDFDSFDTDQGEIDPISEADVYLAYGRYQQAEELIRQAIEDQPNRDECKLKLLEVFYANENKTAFEAYANELAEAGKRDEAEFWEKAAEMGREICPDSPLFSFGDVAFSTVSANVEAAAFEESAGGGLETTESDDLDLTSSEVKNNLFEDEQRNNEDIDFDLSSFSMDTKESDDGVIASNTVLGKSSGTPTNDIDFELSSFSMESDETDQGVIASNTVLGKSSGAPTNDIDFELSSFSMESDETDQGVIASNTVLGKSSGTPTNDIDFELSSFSMESDETDQGVIASNTVLGKSSGASTNDIDFELSSFSMESDETDQGVIASNTVLGKSSGASTNDIDFELSSFSMDATQSDEQDEDVAMSDISLDIPSAAPVANKDQEFESYVFESNNETEEIDDLDFSAFGSSDKTQQDVEFSVDESLELDEDFDFNFDALPTTGGQGLEQLDEFGVSDLTDMDELETKLDLAKAYVDMGDADAAKDIAREVLEQGTVEQKKIAQALLDELS